MDNENYYENYGGLPSQSDIDQWQRENDRWQKARLHHYLARRYLSEYYSTYERITAQDVEKLISIIENSDKEEDIQAFLASHPTFLTHHLGGSGRYCIPKKNLGGMFIPDFLIANLNSFGIKWCAVELKNPKARMFNKNGNPSKDLNKATRQIGNYRDWLKNNLNEARNPKQKKGLGLIGIEPELKCLILIGRRKDIDEGLDETRIRMNREINGEIRTYDWLIEQAQGELVRVENHEAGMKIREELERQGKYRHIDIGDIKE